MPQLRTGPTCCAHAAAPDCTECISLVHSLQLAHFPSVHPGSDLLSAGTSGGCDCHSHIRSSAKVSISHQLHICLFQQAFSVSDFFTNSEPNACVNFLRECFHVENLLYPPDISFSAFYVLCSVCWPPVGPQDIKTYK